jgi:hypothetical protein
LLFDCRFVANQTVGLVVCDLFSGTKNGPDVGPSFWQRRLRSVVSLHRPGPGVRGLRTRCCLWRLLSGVCACRAETFPGSLLQTACLIQLITWKASLLETACSKQVAQESLLESLAPPKHSSRKSCLAWGGGSTCTSTHALEARALFGVFRPRACVCVCVRVCVWLCICVCVRVGTLLLQC